MLQKAEYSKRHQSNGRPCGTQTRTKYSCQENSFYDKTKFLNNCCSLFLNNTPVVFGCFEWNKQIKKKDLIEFKGYSFHSLGGRNDLLFILMS